MEEILEKVQAFGGQERLRMKLNTFHGPVEVAQAHDLTLLGSSRYLERITQGCFINYE